MLEGLIFAMDVSKEMLSTLWKVQYRLKIDNFGTCLHHCRKGFGKQFKIPQFLLS